MKKAFIILAHQLPQQLNIFINQLLLDPEAYVFLHINKLCDTLKSERVLISDKNIEIHWGSDEILKALLIMMNEVLSYSVICEYVTICTGQDLMIKPGYDKYLRENKGKVIIEQLNAEEGFYDKYIRARLLYKWPKAYRRKYDFKYHPIRILRAIRYRYTLTGRWPFSRKKLNYDTSKIVFFKDWYWCAMPRDIVQFIIDFMKHNPDYWSIYDKAYIPEEGFVTTLLRNNGMGDRILNTTLVYIKPMRNNHPPVFKVEDIQELDNCNCYFARKFDSGIDAEVIEYYVNKIKENS